VPEIIEKIIKLGQKNKPSRINLMGSRRVLVERSGGKIEEFLVIDDLENGGVFLKKIGKGTMSTVFLREKNGGKIEVVQSGHMILDETCVEA
jgi:hypothetical protein